MKQPPLVTSSVGRVQPGQLDAESERLVLIVDDSMIVQERLGALIRDTGISCQVVSAENGAAARARFKAQRPIMVVLDIALPDASGLDLLREFKAQRPETPIVVFTTYAFPEFRQRAESSGADFFFNKAVEFEKVCDVLRELALVPTSSTDQQKDGG